MKSLTLRTLLRRSERRHPQRQRGVALIESLVSLLIFSFGVLGLIGLEASAINYSVDAEDRNRAALFASDISSSMWLNGTVTVSAAQLATWQANIKNTALPTGLPGGILKITVTPATTPYADILITWIPVTDKTGTTRQLTTRVIL
jgi:type IV pilus assembly protein PilV